jgi:hypothetical protein
MLELGLASGVSGWIWGSALRRNGKGTLDSVDIAPKPNAVEGFRRLIADGIATAHVADGAEFVERLEGGEYDVAFSDALHTYEFNRRLARALREKLPRATHFYHEWSLSPLASRADARYVSMRVNLGSCGERQAFEEAFTDGYRHIGVPSSCGVGAVLPAR